MASTDRGTKDNKTKQKMLIALAHLKHFSTAEEIAAWINNQWTGRESVSESYLRNVLRGMRITDEHRGSGKLLETEGEHPYRYKLGEFTVKTAASAELLINFNETYNNKNYVLSEEHEQQIKAEISNKYGVPITTLDDRLDKAIKGKYLKRGNVDGFLKPLKRIEEEQEFLTALIEFNPDLSAGKRTNLGKNESKSASLKRSPRPTKRKH